MNLNKLSKEIHEANVAKGFYEDFEAIEALVIESGKQELVKAFQQTFDAQRYALIGSEVSEALEAMRGGNYFGGATSEWKEDLLSMEDTGFKENFKQHVKDTQEDELADILIRVLDYAAYRNIDLDFHVKAKLKYNALRPHKHGKSI